MVKTLTPYGVSALKLATRNNFGVAATPFLLEHLVEMGFLKYMEEISSYGDVGEGGLQVASEARFEITPEGLRIYNKWFHR